VHTKIWGTPLGKWGPLASSAAQLSHKGFRAQILICLYRTCSTKMDKETVLDNNTLEQGQLKSIANCVTVATVIY